MVAFILKTLTLDKDVSPSSPKQGIHARLDYSISRQYLAKNQRVQANLSRKGIVL